MSTLEWPSKRVPCIFDAPKAQYSPKTSAFLKSLIDESRMTIRQKERFNYILRNGKELKPDSAKPKKRSRSQLVYKHNYGRRRTHEEIIASGAYDRERYVPRKGPDREKIKQELQDIMTYGKEELMKRTMDGAMDRRGKNKRGGGDDDHPAVEKNRFDELVSEVRERLEFLEEMEALGQGEKYRPIIRGQIQAKVHEMKMLKSAPE